MKALLTFFLAISLNQASIAQNSYYKGDSGPYLTQEQYDSLKQGRLDKIKKISADVELEENLNEIRRTNDSVIFEFRWNFHLGNDDQSKEETALRKSLKGQPFPLGELKTLDGKIITLEDLKGKPTLINFWFTTCKPCIEEMPALNKLMAQMGDRVNFISVTYEKEAAVRKFLKKHTFDFVAVADASRLTKSLKMDSFPSNVFLDKDGKVVRMEYGIPYEQQPDKTVKMGDEKKFAEILNRLL